MPTHKLTTCLWFDGQAEDAAKHYVSVFPDSSILSTQRYTAAGQDIHGQAPGSVMTVEFSLRGGEMRMVALNGGPQFKHSEAVSFMVECDDQAELDRYWAALGEGGDPSRQVCGWLADRFGVSWQVVPRCLKKMLADRDEARAGRVTVAMMAMVKMDIEALKRAYEGTTTGGNTGQ